MPQPSVHQLYKRLERVGKGAYGAVYKGVHIPTGNVVALKIIDFEAAEGQGEDDIGDIQREVALLTALRDAPNITKYYGCHMDGPRAWIVMELAEGGSVYSIMQASKDKRLEERFVAVIVREVLIALAYLHRVPVIHRDIKAANVLITSACNVMICDFGVSALMQSANSKRNTMIGTPLFMAPELLGSVASYDTTADIWSLGIMIYEMIMGHPPHSHLNPHQAMDLIPRVKPPTLPESDGSKELRDFMAMCLKEVPSERATAEELLKTKWMKSTQKTSLTILKDLLGRVQRAAPRESLAQPMAWEAAEEEECVIRNFGRAARDSNAWEFDTVKGRRISPYMAAGDEDTVVMAPIPEADPTVRPAMSTTVPSSLRAIFGDDTPAPPPPPPTLPTPPPHREHHRSRGPPNIEIPPSFDSLDLSSPDPSGSASNSAPEQPNDNAVVGPRPMRRRRSQSTGESLDAPAPFQFPAAQKVLSSAAPAVTPLQLQQKHARTSPTHASASASSSSSSTASLTPGAHQATYSLDTLRRAREGSPVTPPSMSRTRSATAAQDISLEDIPLVPPVRPYAATPGGRNRSGSDSSQKDSLGTPALKDVMKIPSLSSEHRLGISDLLPPSPSAAMSNSRSYAPPPASSLGTAVATAGYESFRDAAVASGASFTLGLPRTSSPPPEFRRHGHRPSSSSITSIQSLGNGPPVRPLDYAALVRDGSTHSELARTIEELGQWLSVVETGLGSVLDSAFEDIIEEEGGDWEAEDSSSGPDMSSDDAGSSHHQRILAALQAAAS
ncbi:STE/STE20/YSK protein kinase [Schizophyllum fasciatum]